MWRPQFLHEHLPDRCRTREDESEGDPLDTSDRRETCPPPEVPGVPHSTDFVVRGRSKLGSGGRIGYPSRDGFSINGMIDDFGSIPVGALYAVFYRGSPGARAGSYGARMVPPSAP